MILTLSIKLKYNKIIEEINVETEKWNDELFAWKWSNARPNEKRLAKNNYFEIKNESINSDLREFIYYKDADHSFQYF